jgi:hypothetical protein
MATRGIEGMKALKPLSPVGAFKTVVNTRNNSVIREVTFSPTNQRERAFSDFKRTFSTDQPKIRKLGSPD